MTSLRRGKNGASIRECDKRYQKRKRKENGKYKTIESKIYRKKYPDRVRAHWALRRVKDRGIIKQQNCEVCGLPNTQAHHTDYLKPLEVKWLCPAHHKLEHLKITKTIKKQ